MPWKYSVFHAVKQAKSEISADYYVGPSARLHIEAAKDAEIVLAPVAAQGQFRRLQE